MSMIVLRRLRIWLIFLSTIVLFTIALEYILAAEFGRFPAVKLRWQDWIILFTTVIFFFAYTYSLKGKPLVNKFLRAFLMFVCSVLILYINLGAIAKEAKYLSGRFECSSMICVLYWINAFLSTFIGFFALFEISLTLKIGPLQPKTQSYGDQANVVFVRPDPPQGYNPGALQHPAMISHQQNHHYPQYPRHQFTHAAPGPGGYMAQAQEQHMVHNNGQALPQQPTHLQQSYALPQPSTATSYQQPVAHDAASSPFPVSGHQQSPSNVSGQPPSPHRPPASSPSPQLVSPSV